MTDESKNIPRLQSNSTSFHDPAQIHEQAKQKAKAMPLPDPDTMTREEIQQRFHELQVRQIEAELQNDQFRSWGEDYKSKAELLATITENMIDVVVLSDLEGNITFAGKTHETLGYEDGSLNGKNVMEFVHPEHLPYVLEEFNKLLTSGGPSTVEYLFRCNDGSYMWLETLGRIVTDESNNPQQILFSTWEITERKQAAKTIENERAFLSAVIENIGDAIVICDAEGRIARFNEKARRLHGLAEQPVQPEQWSEHYNLYQEDGITPLPMDDIPLFRALQGERVQNAEIVVVPKHGRPYFLVCSGQALTDETGEINGAVIVMHDITDRKRMEEALRESEERLDLAMMVKNEGIWDWNLVSNETVFDERYYIMAGYAPNEFPQNFTAWGERVHPDDLPNAEAAIKAYLSRRSDCFDTEFRFRHRDGSWIWIRARGKIVEQDENGAPLRMIGTHTNITERRHAEEALRHSENYYRAIFETAGTAMLIIEEDTTISLVNTNFVELSGYSKQEIEGKKSWTEFVHPDDVAWMKENHYLRHPNPDAVPRRYEFRFITRYEEMKHILLDVDMIPESNQSIASCIDITERKQAEEALRESEEKLRFVMESSGIGAWELDLFDNSAHRSLEHDRIFGYTELLSEWTYERFLSHVLPEDRSFVDEKFRRSTEIGGEWNFECRIRRVDREVRWIWASGRQRIDAAGNVNRMAGLVQDITERKRMEEDIKESEARLDAILEQLPLGVGLIDNKGKFLLSNSALKVNVPSKGIPSREPAQMEKWKTFDNNGNLVPPNNWPGARALRGETVSGMEFIFTEEDGTELWKLVYAAPFRSHRNEMPGAVVVAQDITKRKNTERNLHELTADLEKKVSERTALAENRSKQLQALTVELIEAEERERRRIAHVLHDDLQQMLAGTRLMLQSVSERLPPMSEIVEVQQLLEESIKKSRNLSHELSPPVLHHASLVAALEWLARQMKAQFGLNAELENKTDFQLENAPLKVFAFRAVQELLFNIVKHAGINSARVEISNTIDNFYVNVSDEGTGFDPEALNRYGKVGFGLLTISERADYIGAQLGIESTPGQGSRFTLKFPLDMVSKESQPQTATGAGDQMEIQEISVIPTTADVVRVLFVDDHKVMRQGLIKLIDGQPGIHVVGEAANGLEAINQTRRLNPDVIVMDVSMPEMDGIEATRIIKAELPEVRVVGLSMHEDEHIYKAMCRAGAGSFVNKASSPAQLLKAIYGVAQEKSC